MERLRQSSLQAVSVANNVEISVCYNSHTITVVHSSYSHKSYIAPLLTNRELTRIVSVQNRSLPSCIFCPFLCHGRLFLGVEPALLDGGADAANILFHVLAVELRGLCIGGAVWVWIVEEGLDGGQDGGNIVCGGPSVLEDVETELAVGVDVWMEHAGEELDGGRLVGVGFVECEGELEGAVFERRVSWGRWVSTPPREMRRKRVGEGSPGPKMTAFHSMMLSGHGLPEMPSGGSVESRLKSRMRRRRQLVDYGPGKTRVRLCRVARSRALTMAGVYVCEQRKVV